MKRTSRALSTRASDSHGAAAVAVAVAVAVFGLAACTNAAAARTNRRVTPETKPQGPCPWVGSTRPVPARVAWVLGSMTLAEKVSMVHGAAPGTVDGFSVVVPGVARLCIPPLQLADGPGGVGDFMTGVTQLPAPVAMAAAWDPSLADRYGAVIGSEAHTKGVGVLLGPTINIVRDPRWGRAFESLGEDPFLTAQLAAADIRGIQSTGTIAQVKHFAVYNQETGRDTAADNAIVDERTLREIYLPAFEAAVRDGHVGSVMCAYSTVNGAPACANQMLLTDVLKREWGFEGFVGSDWYANLPGVAAATRGLDIQMPDNCLFGPVLTDALSTGRVALTRLDDMVGRILGAMFRSGLIDRPSTGTLKTPATTDPHVDLARTVAARGSVLLRNEGVLPIDPTRVRSMAVIGSGATRPTTVGGGSATVIASSTVTPFDGITRRAEPAIRVTADDGSVTARAAMTAASADVAVVFAGRVDSEFHDHTTLDLPTSDTALVRAVAAANPRTVVVLTTGSAVVMPWLNNVAAVLETWYPGQADGDALASLLFGDVNPSGKLPVTFPASLADVPAATAAQWPGGAGTVEYSEGIHVGYRSYDTRHVPPLFPFGFGLSYTRFAFDDLRVTSPDAGAHVFVDATVTNVGSRTGADVVQLYVGDPPSTGEPPHQLRAFGRVMLNPGQQTRVRLTLDAGAFSHWDERTRTQVAPRGRYELFVGDSSATLPVHGGFDLPRTIVVHRASAPSPDAAAPPVPNPADLSRCPIDAAFPKANAELSTPVTP